MPAVQQTVKTVSWAPADFAAGGLLNDVDVEIESAEWTTEGPPNYTASAMFAKMSLKILSDGNIVDQWWSAGAKALEHFTPSDDGRFLIPSGPGGASQLMKGSNFNLFVESLVGKGFHESKCNDMLNLKSLQMHVIQQTITTRPGMTAGKDGRDSLVMLCERIIKLPGDRVRGRAAVPVKPITGKPATTTTTTPAPDAEPSAPDNTVDPEYAALALETLRAVLTGAPDSTMERKLARVKVFSAIKNRKTVERNAVLELLGDNEWLAANGFLADETTVTLVE